LENSSCVKIQSFARSFLVRRRLHLQWRKMIEEDLEYALRPKLAGPDVQVLRSLIGRAAVMFESGGGQQAKKQGKRGGDKILVSWHKLRSQFKSHLFSSSFSSWISASCASRIANI
jgi:hypothetical protein